MPIPIRVHRDAPLKEIEFRYRTHPYTKATDDFDEFWMSTQKYSDMEALAGGYLVLVDELRKLAALTELPADILRLI